MRFAIVICVALSAVQAIPLAPDGNNKDSQEKHTLDNGFSEDEEAFPSADQSALLPDTGGKKEPQSAGLDVSAGPGVIDPTSAGLVDYGSNVTLTGISALASPAPAAGAILRFSFTSSNNVGWSTGPTSCALCSSSSYPMTRRSGSTPSFGTGPSSGPGGLGSYYYYAETSWPRSTSTFELAYDGSGCGSNGMAAVSFEYSMYAREKMGKFSGSKNDGMGCLSVISGTTKVWGKCGNQGSSWLSALSVSLPTGATGFKFSVAAISWRSDAAIGRVTVQCASPPPPLPPPPPPPPPPLLLKCGRKKICVGQEGDHIYCYGSSKGCKWGSNDCSSDADCVKYSAASAKWSEPGTEVVCPVSPSFRWQADACPTPPPPPPPPPPPLKCGQGFCVGQEGDRIYCYGSSKGCKWSSNDCSSDADCVKYSAASAKWSPGTEVLVCPVSPSFRWQADACPPAPTPAPTPSPMPWFIRRPSD